MNNISDWIVNINNTSYKFTKSTILKANKAIGHIKKNKKLYRYCVIYLAICLMPVFATIGKEIIYEFIVAIANVPSDMLLNVIFNLFLQVAKLTTIVLVIFEVTKLCIMTLIRNITR